jgi:cell division protein FtsL
MEEVMSDTLLRPVSKVQGLSLDRPRLTRVFLFLAVLLVVSLFFVWSRLQMVGLQYDISRLDGRLREVRREVRCLHLEAASLRSPARIEKVARTSLGLHNPSPQQVIYVKR